jgi:surfeit locus 1 family protein
MTIRSWLFAGLALVAAAVCIRLGFWQLDRLDQRLKANDALFRGLDQAPVPFVELASKDSVPSYRRVTVQGAFDHDHEIVLTARSLQDQPGFHLVSPLRLNGGEEVLLVDRGWIPYAAGSELDLSRFHTTGEVEIEGVVKTSQESPTFLSNADSQPSTWRREWRALDVKSMSGQFPYPLFDVYVAQTGEDPVKSMGPIPQPEIDLSRGPHLAYAIQWFGFAAVALFGGGYWLRKRLRNSS